MYSLFYKTRAPGGGQLDGGRDVVDDREGGGEDVVCEGAGKGMERDIEEWREGKGERKKIEMEFYLPLNWYPL